MATFLLVHRHEPAQCRFAFAAWRGFASPLRHGTALSNCLEGGHTLWWVVQVETGADALEQLPPYVRERTEAITISEITIP